MLLMKLAVAIKMFNMPLQSFKIQIHFLTDSCCQLVELDLTDTTVI